MQDFNSVYSDYHEAFSQGHKDGAQQAKQHSQQDFIREADQFARQLGTQIAIYETFIKGFLLTKIQDTQKSIKKLHSYIIEQKISQFKLKIDQITNNYLQSNKSLEQLGYSVELLQYDRKDLKSKFQTILSILGMKQYEKKALQYIGEDPNVASNPNTIIEDQDQQFDF